MIDNPRYLTIGRLFGEQNIFKIPKYQRNYAWEDTQIDDFWQDLLGCYNARTNNTPKEHFFGGIVFISKPITGSSCNQCDLIDGQQRISTFVIFADCIKSLYMSMLSHADGENKILLSKRIEKIKNKYLQYEDEKNRKIVTVDKLELSGPDKQFFKDKIKEIEPNIARDSHKRLIHAFRTLKSKLIKIINSFNTLEDKMDALNTFENILDEDCSIIIVPTKTETDAYRIFQVLNDRGISLSEGDLLRARTLELLEDHESYQVTAEKEWDDILSDPPSKTSDFLKWYYASVKGTRPSPTSLLDDFSKEFFSFDTNEMNIENAVALTNHIKRMKDEVYYCREIVGGDWPYVNPSVSSWDRNRLKLLVNELKHTHCIPLLLAACQLSENKFTEVVQMIERSFFRYKIICNQHINSLTKIYHNHSKLMRENPATYNVNQLKVDLSDLLNRKANDETFKYHLNELEYRTTGGNKNLKYFLLTLENYYEWYSRGANGSPKVENKSIIFDFSNITIEHLYSQNPRDPIVELDDSINKLGNLTFLNPRANERLGNKPYNEKLPTLKDSRILMNIEITQNTSWSLSNFNIRHAQLLKMGIKVFTL